MAQEKSGNALAQYGPVGAPVAGVVFLILFVVAIVMTSGISEGKDALQKSVKAVRAKLDSPDVEPGGGASIPLPDSVTASMATDAKDTWKPADGATKLLGLPIHWQVTMDPKPEDEFAQFDENGDGSWDLPEFQRTIYYTGAAPKNEFKNWDRNSDGLISKAEYEDPPTNIIDKFNALDKDGDGFLTAKAGEISAEDEYAWDRYPFDGKIDLHEYEIRYEPHDEVNLGAVKNVQAKIDPATMEIVVTWDDPDLESVPSDIAFFIKRRAPETIAKRRSAYSKLAEEYNKKLRAWDDDFSKWWSDEAVKKQFPRKRDAEKKYEEDHPKPVEPEQASEWEDVVAGVTGNEYRDSNFETEVTYTYAVYMGTKLNPKRNQEVEDQPKFAGWHTYPNEKATKTIGHPVYVRNRIAMAFAGAAGASGNIALTKWHAVVTMDESTGKSLTVWYRVQVTERGLEEDDPVGGNYSKSELESRGLKVMDVSGGELPVDDVLPSDVRIDFDTGYRFVTKIGSNFLLTSSNGDFELPKDTIKDMTPTPAPSTDNPMEVRCISVKNGGKEATFEVTRWYKAGDEWLRIVWKGAVKKGDAVGGQIKLGSPGKGVEIKDAKGENAPTSLLSAHKDETVELGAGSYDELDGRNIVIDGESFDLFGSLYKE